MFSLGEWQAAAEAGYRPDSCRNTLQGGPAGRVVELGRRSPRPRPGALVAP